MTGVDLLEHPRGDRGRGGGHRGAAQAKAQQELLVFLLDLKDLQNPRAGRIQRGPGFGQAGVAAGGRPQGGQGLVQALGQRPLPLKQRGVRRALMLLEEAVLLPDELVQLVAGLLVLVQRFQ